MVHIGLQERGRTTPGLVAWAPRPLQGSSPFSTTEGLMAARAMEFYN